MTGKIFISQLMSCKRWLLSVNGDRCNKIHYSTLAPFYHIRPRERTKYATVLHSKIMYCTAKSRFHRFFGRRTEKTKV